MEFCNMKRTLPLLAGLLALPLLAAETATVTFDPGAAGQPVRREVFGLNQLGYQNHRNRKSGSFHNTYDRGYGIWDPENNRPVPEMVEFVRQAGSTVQRYPGGCESHHFNWKKAVGSYEERPNQRFGLPEFLRFCEATGSIPVITLADYYGTPEEAAELVEYLNAPDDGKSVWAAKRAADGRKEPWGVVWFECGNETYHGNHRQGKEAHTLFAPEYTQRYLAFHRAMKAADPRVKLGAVYHVGHWNEALLKTAGEKIDFLSPHIYTGSYPANDGKVSPEMLFSVCLAGVNDVSAKLAGFQEEVKRCGVNRPMPLAITEFNCHFSNNQPLPYRHTLGGALIAAEQLRSFLYDPNVVMAHYWQFSNEWLGMITGYKENFVPRPAFYVYRLFNRYLLDELLPVKVESARYNSPGGFGTPRASGAPSKGGEAVGDDNLLPAGQWKFIGGEEMEKHTLQRNLPDGSLEIDFLDDVSRNYFHASRRMPAEALYAYTLRAEVRTEGMERSSGASIQIGDGRGYDATRSCVSTPPVLSGEWKKVEVTYTPLFDTKSLVIQARRQAGGSPGKMFIRNVEVFTAVPRNIGAQPLVSATLSRSQDRKRLAFIVMNKSMTSPIELSLPVRGVLTAEAETLTAASVADRNTPEDPNAVILRLLPTKLHENTVKITLPPHSLTGINLRLK